jgi:acyl carrier protein
MNERDLEAAVLRALEHAAGGVDDRPIEPERPLAEQFDLDMEAFYAALARGTGIDIPEEDRPRLQTLTGCLEYLSGSLTG